MVHELCLSLVEDTVVAVVQMRPCCYLQMKRRPPTGREGLRAAWLPYYRCWCPYLTVGLVLWLRYRQHCRRHRLLPIYSIPEICDKFSNTVDMEPTETQTRDSLNHIRIAQRLITICDQCIRSKTLLSFHELSVAHIANRRKESIFKAGLLSLMYAQVNVYATRPLTEKSANKSGFPSSFQEAANHNKLF